MEGNEIEKAAVEYIDGLYLGVPLKDVQRGFAIKDFKAGANWQKERENAELTRANAQLDEMVTKYNELSKKYKPTQYPCDRYTGCQAEELVRADLLFYIIAVFAMKQRPWYLNGTGPIDRMQSGWLPACWFFKGLFALTFSAMYYFN